MTPSKNLALFEEAEEPQQVLCQVARPETNRDTARVQMPNRHQLELRSVDLDATLPEDHRARLVWAYVERLELGKLYQQIKAVQGRAGRTPIAPEILLSLWLFATLEGVGSARALSRLCEEHDAYRWLCGGVCVNHHTLSDFRIGQGEVLDELLTLSVANLLGVGAVKLERVAQDGMRVRACAGGGSFRRRQTLETQLALAKEHVDALKAQVASDASQTSRRQQAAQERARRERQDKIEKALKRLPELEAAKDKQRKKGKTVSPARASTTDADATVMKMANGGYNPAYNAQLCTDTSSQVIVGVDMVCTGVDQGQLCPMLEQMEQRYQKVPKEYLVDGGFVTFAQIEQAERRSTIYAPVPDIANDKRAVHAPHEQDSALVAIWRQRMQTDQAQAIYKERAATAECVNALARERGLTRLRVRSVTKAKAVLLLFALAHNVMRTVALAPTLLGLSAGRRMPAG
jgi:transposase